jgi:hypothetical protein
MMVQAGVVSDFADLSYEDWIIEQFPILSGAAFDDDFDEDGNTNGVEYAFDRDPTKVDSMGELRLDLTTKTMHLLVTLPILRSQLIYTAEMSDDLQTWTTQGVTVTHQEGVLSASCAMGEKSRYLRWKITRK